MSWSQTAVIMLMLIAALVSYRQYQKGAQKDAMTWA